MGKQKIDRLLAQLKDNHSQDIQNAAAIFTVAQGAVNQLQANGAEADSYRPINSSADSLQTKALPAPHQLTKADLCDRYGNYNRCRSAAKKAGITLRNPSWAQMVAAFSYLEACQNCINAYMQQHPSADLKGVSVTLSLG